MSCSNPKIPCIVPNDAPQFIRFSSQLVRLGQLAASPPKLNPRNGAIKPAARAGAAVRTNNRSHCGMRSADCGMRSAECGVRIAECGALTAEYVGIADSAIRI